MSVLKWRVTKDGTEPITFFQRFYSIGASEDCLICIMYVYKISTLFIQIKGALHEVLLYVIKRHSVLEVAYIFGNVYLYYKKRRPI